MKKQIFISLTFFTLSFILNSCTKTGPTGAPGQNGAAGNNGLSYQGGLKVLVKGYDQYGDYIGPVVGASVNLDSAILFTVTSAYNPSFPPITNAEGYFVFPVTTGNYIVNVTAPPDTSSKLNYQVIGIYGNAKNVSQVSFVSDTLLTEVGLSQKSTFVLPSGGSITRTTTPFTNIQISLNIVHPAIANTSFIVFVDSTSTVDSLNNYVFWSQFSIPVNSTMGAVSIPYSQLQNFSPTSFASGSRKVYFKIYGEPTNDHSKYIDPTTGKIKFTALSAPLAPVDSVLAP